MKQHIVSKCYLKAWCDPGTRKGHEPYIWLISRDGSTKIKRAPHKSLTRSDAYTVVFNDGKQDLRVETTLSQLEGRFVRVREKIVGGKRLDDFDRAYLAAFMATMHSRTDPIEKGMKKFTEEIDGRVRAMEEMIRTRGVRNLPPRITPAGEGAPITSEDTAYLVRNGLPIFVEAALQTAAPVMFGMSLAFLVAPKGSFFVTSDNPCVWYDPTAYRRPPFFRSPGLAMKDIEITMPICPELMAIMTHNPKAEGYLNLNEVQTNEFNRRVVAFADEQFVSHTEKTLPFWFESGTPPPDAWENQARDEEPNNALPE